MIKIIKLKKTDYKNLDSFYRRIGAVDGNKALVDKVFWSEADYKKLKSELTKEFRKQYSYLRKDKIDSSVGMYLLNLGPSQSVEKVLKPGWALFIDDRKKGI